MPVKGFFAIITLRLLSVGGIAVFAARQPIQPAPPGRQAASQQAEPRQSAYVLKVTSRLVTLDLIATDSHGKTVRDLQPDDLQVFEEHNAQEKIEQFEFIDKEAGGEYPKDTRSADRGPADLYSNRVSVEGLRIPPTVLLLDGLNTRTPNQRQGRLHLLHLLKTLPNDTPVAVFLLGSSLKVLQGFTNDGTLLQAAVDRALSGTGIDQIPAGDPKSISNLSPDSGSDNETEMLQDIQDFEKEQLANATDLRIRQTIDALISIGKYLSGIPGRKNLIWVSESFPLSIVPSTDTGQDPLPDIREYGDQVSAVANALTDAQVAVYPVDIRDPRASQSVSASQPPVRGRFGASPMAMQLDREQGAISQTQETLNELAHNTGGKTCRNANDLSGCVATVLHDSSAYYELAFYPQNDTWDGKFHKIIVKTSRRRVKLTYRRGYLALDASALVKTQPPGDRLYQGCSDQLPSTAVQLTARVVPPSQLLNQEEKLQYLLSISPEGLGFTRAGDSRNLNLLVAVCEFGGNNQSFRFSAMTLRDTVTDEAFRDLQAGGIPDSITLAPASNTRRVRFVLLDESTGLTGAVDVPVLPSEIARATPPALPPAGPVTPSFLEIPDKEQTLVPPRELGSLVFHSNSGKSGAIDWNGDILLYRGEVPIEQSATAFFGFVYGDRFHCESGRLVPNNPIGGKPVLRFTFHNQNGKFVTVDLKGEQPEYLGDLTVDPVVKLIFERVWKSSHCQAP